MPFLLDKIWTKQQNFVTQTVKTLIKRRLKMQTYKVLENQEKQRDLIYDLQFMPSGTNLDSKVRCKKCMWLMM